MTDLAITRRHMLAGSLATGAVLAMPGHAWGSRYAP
ncbi:twin-arginine translocation signal domain-containing protein [Aurantiacibacter aquimixticola]|nr:twin-arginine translocation signal domain-containing protein [Aurantiacibacter aquimixticola]